MTADATLAWQHTLRGQPLVTPVSGSSAATPSPTYCKRAYLRLAANSQKEHCAGSPFVGLPYRCSLSPNRTAYVTATTHPGYHSRGNTVAAPQCPLTNSQWFWLPVDLIRPNFAPLACHNPILSQQSLCYPPLGKKSPTSSTELLQRAGRPTKYPVSPLPSSALNSWLIRATSFSQSASASFNQFKDYADRGNQFEAIGQS